MILVRPFAFPGRPMFGLGGELKLKPPFRGSKEGVLGAEREPELLPLSAFALDVKGRSDSGLRPMAASDRGSGRSGA